MKYKIDNNKLMIMGLQGSGKTYFSKELIQKNNYVVLVYSPHKHDFENENDNFIYFKFNDFIKDFPAFCEKVSEFGKKKLINGVLIDEFDLILRNNYDLKQEVNDLFINHRHYNLFIIAISRRPQDIPTKIFESSKFIICFALQGENVKTKFNNIYKGFGDLVLSLDYSKYEYVLKEIGKAPVKMSKI